MAEYLFAFLPLFLTEAQMFVACFALSSPFDGRNSFPLRIILSIMGGIVLTALCALVCFYMPQTADLWAAGLNIPLSIFAVIFVLFCYRASFREIWFLGSVAAAIRHVAEQTARIICVAILGSGITSAVLLRCGISMGVFTVVLVIVTLIFRRIRFGNKENEIGRFSVFLFPVSLGVIAAIDYAGIIILDFGIIYAIILSVCGIFYGLFMLFAECAFVLSRRSEEELSIIKSLWNEDRKHYEMQKESMEMINIKCHDLRHEIRRLRQGGDVSEQAMKEIENSIYVYDSMYRTGSEVLDVILSDYSLRCRKSKVQLTCMVDGEKITFMDEMDVYSLFGNMLENALEYEQTLLEEDDRFISLTVRYVNGGVSIHTENHYMGSASSLQNIDSTSKLDKRNHGFGIKSMRKIVLKYRGNMDILIADDMFQVDIFLPTLPEGDQQ